MLQTKLSCIAGSLFFNKKSICLFFIKAVRTPYYISLSHSIQLRFSKKYLNSILITYPLQNSIVKSNNYGYQKF